VTPTDAVTLALPITVIFTAALLAAVSAAIGAVRIDPALTLRSEVAHTFRISLDRVAPGVQSGSRHKDPDQLKDSSWSAV
jgi:hypothetical protein